MIQNEPVAALRVIPMLLVDDDGVPLPSGHVFVVGDAKVRKATGAFANAMNLPTAVVGGAPGSFELQLELAEVNTVGTIRAQVYFPNGLFDAYDEVRTLASTVVDSSAVVEGLMERVMNPSAPEYARTFEHQWNLLAAEKLGSGVNLDGGTPGFIHSLDVLQAAVGVGRKAIEFFVQGGKRIITKLDGRTE